VCTNLEQLILLHPEVQGKGQGTAPVHEGHAAAEQPANKDGSQVLPIADCNLEFMALPWWCVHAQAFTHG